ncbi:1-acyl-sn-glycerol-3-phosphate acyltransferase [Candidatus Woesearchaeota archaeon]|nr:1-acyl-sn-glycerol-3-phosphate acyltransferase [Candidatus Woesearchaeota archaeon]
MQEDFKEPNQINWIHDIIAWGGNAFLHNFYNIHYTNVQNLPEKGPFFLLPKHQSYADIFLEQRLIVENTDQRPYYVAKDSLPGILDKVGVVRVTRKKDIKALPKEERRDAMQKAKEQLDYMNWAVPELLQKGNIWVIHPEATRNYKQQGIIDMDVVERIVSYKTEDTVFVPLDITYHTPLDPMGSRAMSHPFAKDVRANYDYGITLDVKYPLRTDDPKELCEYLADSIDLLVAK